jgi:hypothetical protein
VIPTKPAGVAERTASGMNGVSLPSPRQVCRSSRHAAFAVTRPSVRDDGHCGPNGRARRQRWWDRRTFGNATTLDRRVAQVWVTDPHHPLYGKCFPVSHRRSGRGSRVVVIQLPDGRERGISRSATATTTTPDDLAAPASRQPHISVRTLLPLANHVRAVLASRNADLEGGGGRDLDRSSANQAGCSATAVAADTNGDTASTCPAGGTARAAPAAARSLRGEPSC